MTPRRYFRDTVALYTRAAGTGAGTGTFTVLAVAAFPCRVDALSLQPAPTGPARAELAARRQFQWSPDDTLPAVAFQVLAEGVRWNPTTPGSPLPVKAPVSGATIAFQVELVRAL